MNFRAQGILHPRPRHGWDQRHAPLCPVPVSFPDLRLLLLHQRGNGSTWRQTSLLRGLEALVRWDELVRVLWRFLPGRCLSLPGFYGYVGIPAWRVASFHLLLLFPQCARSFVPPHCMNTSNLRPGTQRQEDQAFKVIFSYIMSSRPACAICKTLS